MIYKLDYEKKNSRIKKMINTKDCKLYENYQMIYTKRGKMINFSSFCIQQNKNQKQLRKNIKR